MDNDHQTRLDQRPDNVAPSIRVRLDPVQRQGRIAEALDFAGRAKSDPRETAMLDEVEALQADNPTP